MEKLSYASESSTSPWTTYLRQIDRVAPYLGDLAYWVETLRHPKRALIVDIPVQMDDGTIRHFEGYRVQHNLSRGPGHPPRFPPHGVKILFIHATMRRVSGIFLAFLFWQGPLYMFDTTLLILLGLAALGFISHNTTVAISILVLIIVRVTPLNAFFPWVEKQGLTVGIIILTIGVMAPIASGTLPPSTLIHSFMNWKSLLAIAVGVFVSWLGGRGVSLMGSQPHLVARNYPQLIS